MAKSGIFRTGMNQAAKFAFTKDGELNPRAHGMLERLLSVQRPVVLAYVRSVRRRHPDASPEELAKILGDHYLNVATGGGAAVGATAIVPGVGTGAALGLAAAETGGFLELSALYAQSIAEIHGLPVRDPKRANALVMGLMLGNAGRDLVKRFSAQQAGGEPLTANWGTLVASQIPSTVMDALVRKMRKTMTRKYAARTGGSVLGRALPFGVGAVIGGVVNRQLAKSVVKNAGSAFGALPAQFDLEFERETAPSASSEKRDADLMGGLRKLLASRKGRDEQDVQAKGRGSAKRGRRGGDPDVVIGEVDDDAPRTHGGPDVRL